MTDTVLTNIKRLCKERGISLSEACRRAGVATNYLSDKAGKADKSISPELQEKFAAALGVEPSDLEAGGDAPLSFSHLRVPIALLRLSDLNPRQEVDENVGDLAANIHEHGLLENLVVRRVDRAGMEPAYEVVAGGRRLAALEHLAAYGELPADLLELGVPCRLVEGDDATMMLLGLSENLQREAMNPMDEARAIYRLNQDMGLSTAEIADKLAMSQRAIQQRLTFVTKLSPLHQAQLREGVITYRQALDLVQQHRPPEPPPAASETVSQPLPACWKCGSGGKLRSVGNGHWSCDSCTDIALAAAEEIQDRIERENADRPAPACWRCGQMYDLQSTGLGTWICEICVESTKQIHADRAARRGTENPTPVRTCRVCGCTDLRACEGGCSWVGDTLCSACQVAPDAADKVESDRLAAAIDKAKGAFPPPVRIAPDMDYLTEVIAQELADGFPGEHVFWCLVAVPPWTETSKPVIYAGSSSRKDAQEAVTELSYVLDGLEANALIAPPRDLTPEQLQARQGSALAKLETQHGP